jgi:hypothetical protein
MAPMADVAGVAVHFWPRDVAITMTAIAVGCESGGDPTAAGDPYVSVAQFCGPDPAAFCFFDPREGDYRCSVGLWQIFMCAHALELAQLTGSNDPRVWAFWLIDPFNNAQIAHELWADQGFAPWGTDIQRACFQDELADATLAVDNALRGPPPPVPGPAPFIGGAPGCDASGRVTIEYLINIQDGLPATLLVADNIAFANPTFLGPYSADAGVTFTPPAAGTWYAQLSRFAAIGNVVAITIPSVTCGAGPPPSPSPPPPPAIAEGGSMLPALLLAGVTGLGIYVYERERGRVHAHPVDNAADRDRHSDRWPTTARRQ